MNFITTLYIEGGCNFQISPTRWIIVGYLCNAVASRTNFLVSRYFAPHPVSCNNRIRCLPSGPKLPPHAFDRIVGDRPQARLMSMIHEKRPFVGDHHVLAACLLKKIMDQENTHMRVHPTATLL